MYSLVEMENCFYPFNSRVLPPKCQIFFFPAWQWFFEMPGLLENTVTSHHGRNHWSARIFWIYKRKSKPASKDCVQSVMKNTPAVDLSPPPVFTEFKLLSPSIGTEAPRMVNALILEIDSLTIGWKSSLCTDSPGRTVFSDPGTFFSDFYAGGFTFLAIVNLQFFTNFLCQSSVRKMPQRPYRP